MILITRPKDRAKRISEILNKRNIPHHIDSLIKFRDIEKIKLEPFNDICLISSTEGVHSLRRNNLIKDSIFNNCSLNIIGEQTANLLNELGVQNINKIFQDFKSFKKYIDDHHNSKKIDYLCSDIISDEAQQQADEGKINKIVLYKTFAAERFSDLTLELIERNKLHSVLIYSKFTATTFRDIVQKHDLLKQARNLKYYCLSERIAQELQKSGFKDCQISSYPNQLSLLDLLN